MVERLLERDALRGRWPTRPSTPKPRILPQRTAVSALPDSWTLTLEAIDRWFATREKGAAALGCDRRPRLLDLVPLPETLRLLFDLLGPEGTFYFTINFDGETIFGR